MLVFSDVSYGFRGSCVTQRPLEGLNAGGPVANVSHEPLAILSWAFKGLQMRWPVVDKGAFAIMATLLQMAYLFWDGAHIFCDHRNLAHILHPEACAVPTTSKARAQRLQRWSAFLRQFRYTIIHIPGEQNL